MYKIVGEALTQKFNRRPIFKNISFEISSQHSLVITGKNGAGKSTLVKIICQLLQPSSGSVQFLKKSTELELPEIQQQIGLVSPYLQLYNQLSALENFQFFSRIRGINSDIKKFKKLMDMLSLRGRELDPLKTYSSGMLQRAKYVMALLHQPNILILDEPTANLDEEGSAVVYEIMKEQMKDKILLIATNEPDEIKYGESRVEIV